MSISKNSNINPVICKIQFVLLKNISAINKGSDNFYRRIQFNSGFGFEDMYFTPGTAVFNEPLKNTADGDIFEQSLSFFFPGDDKDNPTLLFPFIKNYAVFKITYSSGVVKLIGNFDNPAFAKFSFSGNDKTGRNFKVECSSPYPAFIYG